MSTAKKILGSTAIQVFGRIITALASAALVNVLSNYLGIAGYGQYAAVYELLALFTILADFGLFVIAVREMSRDKADRSFILGNILGMRIMTSVIALGLAIGWVYAVQKYEGTWVPLGVLISSLGVLFTLMQGTLSSILQVELKMLHATLPQVLGRLLNIAWVLVIIFYVFSGGASLEAFAWIMAGSVVTNFFTLIWTYVVARKIVPIRPRFEGTYWWQILKRDFPYGLALVLGTVYFRIDSTLIPLLREKDGYEQLGIYSVAMRILEILNILPVYFMNSSLPTLVRRTEEGKGDDARVFQMCFDFLLIIALPMAAGLFLLAYPVVSLIAADEFLSQTSEGFFGSDFALQILVFSMIFSFFGNLFTFGLIALGKQNQLLWICGFAAFFNIALNWFLIPIYGFIGAAVMTVVTEFMVFAMAWWAYRRYVTHRLNLGGVWKVILSTLIMTGGVWLIKDPLLGALGSLGALPLSAFGALIYGACLYLFKGIPENLKQKILSRAS